MTDSWDDIADEWDKNEAVILYCQKAYESLLESIDLTGLDVMDFGCGTGLLTERIVHQASSVVAIDPSEKMIAVLADKQLHNVSVVQSELTQELIDHNETLRRGFDLILASSVLAFVPDYQQTLHRLKRLLRKGGYLVQWDWLQRAEEPGFGFSQEVIESALNQAGFSKHSLSIPFSMESPDQPMKVVMAVAENT